MLSRRDCVKFLYDLDDTEICMLLEELLKFVDIGIADIDDEIRIIDSCYKKDEMIMLTLKDENE